jgi:hypothetical protein
MAASFSRDKTEVESKEGFSEFVVLASQFSSPLAEMQHCRRA